jgi:hypothetical protein
LLYIAKVPKGGPEAKREAAFGGPSNGTTGQGLTGQVEKNAIVAAEKTKGIDRIAERQSGAMHRWFSRLPQLRLFPSESGSDRGAPSPTTSHQFIRTALLGDTASRAKTETLTDMIRAHGLWFYL